MMPPERANPNILCTIPFHSPSLHRPTFWVMTPGDANRQNPLDRMDSGRDFIPLIGMVDRDSAELVVYLNQVVRDLLLGRR